MLTADQVERWREDGFFIVEGFLEEQACRAL